MSKFFLIAGAILGAVSVMIGAFGAHALKATLAALQRLETFETAVKYQFYHTLAILLVGLLLRNAESKWMVWAGYSFLAGIVIFSGSLYILSTTGITKWGAVTPVGGLAFILGWIFLAVAIFKIY